MLSHLLRGYPCWSQLRVPPSHAGALDPFHDNDCGETCVSMLLWGRKRVYRSPGELRRALSGPPGNGRTSAAQLALLLTFYGVRAHPLSMNRGLLKRAVIRDVKRQAPMLALGYWLVPGILHWYLIVGYGLGGFYANDPWTGTLVHRPWSVLDSLATGDVVRLPE